MTPEETMQLAKEAGIEFEMQQALSGGQMLFTDGSLSIDRMKRFASLVAEKVEARANERANASWKLMCEKMVAAEREACALACDAKAHEVRLWCNESNVIACAASIRARGQKEGA